jgi:hypothetical protein
VKKPHRDAVRKDRIHEDAIVDASGPEEQAPGWYYNLEKQNPLSFFGQVHRCQPPFSPLRKGETLSVRRLAPEQACAHDMLVRVAGQGRNVAIPLA